MVEARQVSQIGRMVKAVIFDMDGTLVSTLPLIIHCVNQIAEKYLRKTLTVEEVMATFGPLARDIVHNLAGGSGNSLGRDAVEDYYDCYRLNCGSRALLFPGIPELLQKVRESGRHLAVVTGVERILMDHTLATFGLEGYFEVLVSGDHVQRPKPDPEGIGLALQRLRMSNREALIIGDSLADITAGKNAGILTGAALWSPEGRGDPTDAAPDYSFRSVGELASFLMPENKDKRPAFYFAEDKSGPQEALPVSFKGPLLKGSLGPRSK